MLEGLAVFIFYNLIFLVCLVFLGILEHFEKVQAKKRTRAMRQARVKRAKIEYLKLVS